RPRDNATTRQRDNATTRQRDNATTRQRDNATTRQRDNATTPQRDNAPPALSRPGRAAGIRAAAAGALPGFARPPRARHAATPAWNQSRAPQDRQHRIVNSTVRAHDLARIDRQRAVPPIADARARLARDDHAGRQVPRIEP